MLWITTLCGGVLRLLAAAAAGVGGAVLRKRSGAVVAAATAAAARSGSERVPDLSALQQQRKLSSVAHMWSAGVLYLLDLVTAICEPTQQLNLRSSVCLGSPTQCHQDANGPAVHAADSNSVGMCLQNLIMPLLQRRQAGVLLLVSARTLCYL
jgi:hypothetical protein